MTVPIYQGALRPLAVLISLGVISLNRAPIAIITGRSLVYGVLVLSLQGCSAISLTPYPPSPVIKEVIWDHSSHRQAAPGSDLWPITWADDDNLYTVWGDGGGFGGTDSEGRVTLGVARIAGNPDNLQATNVFGGKNPEAPADFNGKSNGLISIDGVLYMHVVEEGKWLRAKIGRSTDHGKTWTFNSSTGWDFTEPDGAFSDLAFLNFGKNYQGARDGYVYVYSQDKRASMTPDFLTASVAMFRVPKAQLMNRSAYEYFAGLDANNNPYWTKEIAARKSVFSDPNGVGWGVSVEYNPGLKRYLLTTFHVWDGSWGIFDAPEPWGPWTTVAYYNRWIDSEPKFGFSFPAKAV
jgi:Domain of unknown function (DUF4185)